MVKFVIFWHVTQPPPPKRKKSWSKTRQKMENNSFLSFKWWKQNWKIIILQPQHHFEVRSCYTTFLFFSDDVIKKAMTSSKKLFLQNVCNIFVYSCTKFDYCSIILSRVIGCGPPSPPPSPAEHKIPSPDRVKEHTKTVTIGR